jgi:hypothetical protein
MTAPKPKLETATTPQDPEPTPSDVVEVQNLTLEAALKIVRELINRESQSPNVGTRRVGHEEGKTVIPNEAS